MNNYTAYLVFNSYNNDIKFDYLEACRLWIKTDNLICNASIAELDIAEDELESHFVNIRIRWSLSCEHSFNLTQALVSCLEANLFPEFNEQYETYIAEWEN